MTAIPHIPALRLGEWYSSLDASDLKDLRSGEVLAKLSQVNAGIVKRDLRHVAENARPLREMKTSALLEACGRAADLFLNQALPIDGQGTKQSPEDYVSALSSTSGLPHVLVRANMDKVATVFRQMPAILKGLTRGLDLSVLDGGRGVDRGLPLCYARGADALGVVLPSNSPGVNSIWMPAIALKVPVILKPGREEPWTPMRIVQAFVAAGVPRESFGFYPTDHQGSQAILQSCGRSLLFGDERTTAPYAGNPSIQIHGPGRSKVLIGSDEIDRWEQHLDVLVASIASNGGRSCINASAIVVPARGDEVARALAARLADLRACSLADPEARLAAFANPAFADFIDQTIEQGLAQGGAQDVTAAVRGLPRKVVHEGGTFLLPTIVRCTTFEHPLANTEFLFPYASVVEIPEEQMLEKIGPSLVVTAITRNAGFRQRLIDTPLISRLNLGPVPTSRVEWDQPHEGNLFEFLYLRRAIQTAQGW